MTTPVYTTLEGQYQELWNNIKQGLEHMAESFRDAILNMQISIAEQLRDTLNSLYQWVTSRIDGAVNSLENITSQLGSKISQMVDHMDSIRNNLTARFDSFIREARANFDATKSIIEDNAQKVSDTVRSWGIDTLNSIEGAISTISNGVLAAQNTITNWMDRIGNQIQARLTAVKDTITDTVNGIIGKVSDIIQTVAAVVKERASAIMDKVSAAAEGVKEVVTSSIDNIKEWFSTLFEDIVRLLQDIWMDARNFISGALSIDPENVAAIVKQINTFLTETPEVAPPETPLETPPAAEGVE